MVRRELQRACLHARGNRERAAAVVITVSSRHTLSPIIKTWEEEQARSIVRKRGSSCIWYREHGSQIRISFKGFGLFSSFVNKQKDVEKLCVCRSSKSHTASHIYTYTAECVHHECHPH
eukprot:GHVU01187928.1.p1 GENE.GHVU01187928.1~~GHVU01187928.1.p1  ORF type:complete len:119 (-),score=5.09 GHVU01187928.1:155-511(-)